MRKVRFLLSEIFLSVTNLPLCLVFVSSQKSVSHDSIRHDTARAPKNKIRQGQNEISISQCLLLLDIVNNISCHSVCWLKWYDWTFQQILLIFWNILMWLFCRCFWPAVFCFWFVLTKLVTSILIDCLGFIFKLIWPSAFTSGKINYNHLILQRYHLVSIGALLRLVDLLEHYVTLCYCFMSVCFWKTFFLICENMFVFF